MKNTKKMKTINEKPIKKFLLSLLIIPVLLTACGKSFSTDRLEENTILTVTEQVAESRFSEETSIHEESTEDQNSSTVADKALTTKQQLEVHFLDIGQGDATLIQCDGYYMLIDAGDNTQGTAIQLYLQKQNVEKLDYLILTHPDADHIGGAPVVITKFDIGKVFMSDFTKDNKTYDNLLKALNYKGLHWTTPAAGDSFKLGSSTITFIAPNATYNTPNNSSIGLIIQNGNNTFLFTGDAEDGAEQDILRNELDIKADVYQVGHHGSRSSSSEAFLDVVNPLYAVISCGADNSYGHPHAQTLNAFRSRNIQVFRTDEQGTIVAVSDGETITWNCAPSESWLAGEPTQNSGGGSNEETPKAKPPVAPQSAQQETELIEVHITKTGTKYHQAGCSSLKNSDISVSLSEAKERGLKPCKNCNPPE